MFVNCCFSLFFFLDVMASNDRDKGIRLESSTPYLEQVKG